MNRQTSENRDRNNAWCVKEALAWATRELAHIARRPRFEAERLLAAQLCRERTTIIAHPEWTLDLSQAGEFKEAVRRRTRGTPLPYITGEIEFFGLTFAVTPDVLIPRPETELLVEQALSWLGTHAARRIVDVGTGSGCIAVALATQTLHPAVVATDISIGALRVAQANARRHEVAAAIRFVQGNLLAPFSGPIDLILSNPPYIADSEWHTLLKSVRREPRHALLSGTEGLDAIKHLLNQARLRLAAQGCLLVEIGETQGNAVQALAQAAFPNSRIAILPDLADKDRLLRILRV